jgi:pyrroloquinoline quinone biosynthesis protein D
MPPMSAPKQRKLISGTSVPRLAPHTTFRHDATRNAWVLLAPERLLLPDEQAVEILQLADGSRSVDAIVDSLAQRYAAPREVIAGDVLALFQDLADKALVTA